MTDGAPASFATRRDRLKQLQAFCETIRLGSISSAAKALELSQPALSKRVQSLEEVLGVVLLRRQSPRLAPTRIGENLYRIARPLVEGLQRLPEFFEEQHFGVSADRLRIGAGEVSGGHVLPGLVERFHARYPRTRLEVRTGSGAQRLEWLRVFELDVALMAFDVAPRDIEFHPLVQADAVVIVPEDHPLGCRESVAIGELARHRMVVPVSGSYVRQLQEVILRAHGVRPRIVLEVADLYSMINCVAAGVGIAVVPALCVSSHERVRTLALEHSFRPRTYGVAARSDRLRSVAAGRFIQVAMAGPPNAGAR